MTEDEAKTKWCPFSRLVSGKMKSGALIDRVEPHNRISDGGDAPRITVGNLCIGSACMAWRWAGYRYTKDYGTSKMGKMCPPEVVEKEGIGGFQGKFPKDHVGFCGLAGAPSPT